MKKKSNFESFDVWGKANFILWSNARFDFELINEIIQKTNSVRKTMYLLNTLNNHFKKIDPTKKEERIFFDGTINSLKFIIKKRYLDLNSLPKNAGDEKILNKILKKYANRLDITDILLDIEEPTLRAMLLEYPNLINETLKNPLAIPLISKAFRKNGVTEINSFNEKIDDGKNSIEVNSDKNSTEAMQCKIIFLGLRLLNEKIQLSDERLIESFKKLSDNNIRDGFYEKSTFNSLYAGLYGQDEWNKNKKVSLTGCENLYLDFQLFLLPENHMSVTYDIFLKEMTEKITKKYFPDLYKKEGHIANLAINMAIIIILYRLENYIPKNEKKDVSIYYSTSMLSSLDYAIKDNKSDPKNPLILKNWFIEYYKKELEKRLFFIKLQQEKKIGIVNILNIERIMYLPVFESFRFFCGMSTINFIDEVIKIFVDRNIDNAIKDEMLISFAYNIQKISSQEKIKKDEKDNYTKDKIILLMIKIFENLTKKSAKLLEHNKEKKTFYDKNEITADASLEIIDLILSFDISKNDSFLGFMKRKLYLNLKTRSRGNKTDQETITTDEDFFDNLPDKEVLLKKLDNKYLLEKIHQYIEDLPKKQKEAILKSMQSGRNLDNKERQNKKRGLDRLKELDLIKKIIDLEK